jgi:peptidoglycan/xylan/chitin deacetylase (PgdA/CDA1 family)
LNFSNTPSGYLSLCYHYIRNINSTKSFPRILGTPVDIFEQHIEMFFKNFEFITPKNTLDFSYGDYTINKNKIGLLITFDDGLSDHYIAAKILAKHGIKALFFLPTCIIEENLPANPIIIHYCIAKFGVSKFIDELNQYLKKYLNDFQSYTIKFVKGQDDPHQTIKKIKKLFKYDLSSTISRKILLELYETMFHSKYSDAMEIMHLTKEQISKMLEMGHSFGTHTYSHISVGSASLDDSEFNHEIVEPKNHLKKHFGIETNFISYPFGGVQDCLSSKELIMKTNSYKLAFTVEEILNKKSTSPFELGRYMPTSMDTAELLYNKMQSMINGE